MILRRVLGWALAALALAAVYMSWGALYDSAILLGGMEPDRAIVFPAIVDLVTIVAMLIALLVPGAHRLAWVTLGVFGAVTIAGNAAHVVAVDSAELRMGEVVAILVNAVPAVALLMVTHLAAVTVYGARREPAEASVPEHSVPDAELELEPRPPQQRRPRAESAERQAARRRAEELRSGDPKLSIAAIAAEVDVPKATVGRWLAPTAG
ncbi:hypothetical protein ACFWGP_05500 [Agromyces sp. NPDC127015]|uniref:hypothetical protein n=1 Tax=Agromyces sp. NPDC127015 TaxID=3347108 RepID=UPI0036464B12